MGEQLGEDDVALEPVDGVVRVSLDEEPRQARTAVEVKDKVESLGLKVYTRRELCSFLPILARVCGHRHVGKYAV